MDRYYAVAKPEEKAPVSYFSSVDPKLFNNIVARYNNGHVIDNMKDVNCAPNGTKG
jgi:cytochrome o ubiquinol oxidase subunit II